MRISDWSSDVCSSDLRRLLTPSNFPSSRCNDGEPPQKFPWTQATTQLRRDARRVDGGARDRLVPDHRRGVDRRQEPTRLPHQRDRKSVVKGKSVSVRVDLGGSRIIKKKKKKKK